MIEDIVDTGRTLDKLIRKMTENGALSVKVAALLNKEARRTIEVPVHFEGFKCEDSFVVGCALVPLRMLADTFPPELRLAGITS